MCGNHMDLKKRVDDLEKELAELKKDYGRLCQNDSVMRTEHTVAFKRLDKQDKDIKELKLLITNLHQECQRLYNIGFSNGIETAYTEISDNIKMLEDKGLISYHGFLMEGKTKPNNELDKLSEAIYNQLGISANKLKPESATKIADEACRLVDEIDSLRKENSHLKYVKSCNESTIESLENTRDLLINKNNELIEENKRLKAEKVLSWKNYQKKIQKKQDRINELEAQLKASEDNNQKNIEYYEKEIKKLREFLKLSEKENYKLKTDCEKLQHGYNDMMFCGGRQNGKQFTFLVDLFKKIDQKKVDAAYKEAYDIMDLCPSWLDGKKWDYISIDEFAFKPVSKREKMWDDILEEGRTPVWVKREDIHDFLEECQVAGIKWSSGKSPLETMPFYMCDGCDGAYFFVMTSLDITKKCVKGFRHVMTWWATACPEEVEVAIHYIRPMRWDLFEKGRIVIKVEKESYGEFCSRMLSHFDKVGVNAFNHDCKFGYFAFNKDTRYVERILSSDNGDAKEINRRKVVDWEDVR